jgi:putative Mn2+ efflux pump MntP
MTLFSIFLYSVAMVTLGFMIGNDSGKKDGYLNGRADVYKEQR